MPKFIRHCCVNLSLSVLHNRLAPTESSTSLFSTQMFNCRVQVIRFKKNSKSYLIKSSLPTNEALFKLSLAGGSDNHQNKQQQYLPMHTTNEDEQLFWSSHVRGVYLNITQWLNLLGPLAQNMEVENGLLRAVVGIPDACLFRARKTCFVIYSVDRLCTVYLLF